MIKLILGYQCLMKVTFKERINMWETIPTGYHRLKFDEWLNPTDLIHMYWSGKWKAIGQYAFECRAGELDVIIRKNEN